jgi:hypothetical protein
LPFPTVRRVVTGQKSNGSSVLTHVEDVAGITNANGLQWYGVWGWQEMPNLPYSTTEPFQTMSVFPASGGVRVNTIVFPPRYGHADATPVAQASDGTYEKLEAGSGSLRHDSQPGMHTTDSVDLGFVSAGELVSIQGDGSEVTLRPGDVYVQNGAMHAWRNDSNEPCMITFVVMGTSREAV